MQTTEILDARNLNCPLPILQTKKALTAMEVGENLKILATDPGSVKDLEAFCQQTGNELVSAETGKDEFIFIIRKS